MSLLAVRGCESMVQHSLPQLLWHLLYCCRPETEQHSTPQDTLLWHSIVVLCTG